MTKAALLALAASACIVGGCATAPSTSAAGAGCDRGPEENRRVVLAFYNEGLVERRPRAAFERHMSPAFIEHKPDVAEGTREGAATFLEQLISTLPGARWEVLRTVAEGDLVFLHARFTPAPGAPPYAIADLFRVQDCKIAEHWDVVAPPPKDRRNPNPRF